MNADVMMERIAEMSPRFKARIAGAPLFAQHADGNIRGVLPSRQAGFRSGTLLGIVLYRCDADLVLRIQAGEQDSLCSRRSSAWWCVPLGLLNGIPGAWTSA
jgi:hypothetical protein